MRKLFRLVPMIALSLFWFASTASAHVVVSPAVTSQGTYEVFTVRVPTEKDTPTVKLEVKVPAEVEISRFEPKEGWSYALTRDSNGKITQVTWTATGAGLSPTEFGTFSMEGKVGDDATELVWKAVQTYKDGSVVEWTGANANTPASVTTVNPKRAGEDAHSHGGGHSETAPSEQAVAGDSKLPLYLSYMSLLFSLLAILISLVRRAK
ncbi:YcnI family protein [Gorillibacterium sp. CAU 1737]|uniref:YcnI family copper-binding membrane protein n=1 Tax=Gorillibacterium sp. CAU 1737 TaxID=3140362 RepID=UPI0032600DE2